MSRAVEGYTNVMATTSYCTSSSCNKAAGKTSGLSIGSGSSVDPVVDETVDDSGAQILFISFSMIIALLL